MVFAPARKGVIRMLSDAHTHPATCSGMHTFISGTNSGRKGLVLSQKPALFGHLEDIQLLGFPDPKHIQIFVFLR